MVNVIEPILSEKTAQGMSRGLYVFRISNRATKNSLKSELKTLYNVDVTGIRIVNLPVRKITFRRKSGQRAARRKAYIQLKAGQSIPGFELKKENKSKIEK